ncbi:hypothetical protein [Pseudoalteromonas sp. S1688]|uniref:hypothetical protein n=1 Tax=Pseudoalteromonas sp. S1688 TaxID=579511 RepID=UPI00110A9F68|nr:hypothetical protein [Pseudoalteromonas sp. S1688]TMP51424.1 hypothetical protein CWB81_05735 [Pseudoalteromonas sp. S1688]
MAEKNKTSRFTWLVLILIVLGVYASTLPDRTPTPAKPIEPSEFQKINQQLTLTFEQKTLSNGLLNVKFKLKNASKNDIHDVSFRCSEFSQSNTVLSRHVQTVYQVLSAGSEVEHTINMGESHPQAYATQCIVMNFKY